MTSDDVFVMFKEFRTHGVPQYSRRYTNAMVDAGTFPPPVRLSANRIAWRLSDLERWKETRPLAREVLPVLWPVQTPVLGRGQVATAYTRGRPPGSKLINGKLVRREELEGADAAA